MSGLIIRTYGVDVHLKAWFTPPANPRFSLSLIKFTRSLNSSLQSIEKSREALSITRILTLVVVAMTDSIHVLSKSPEFQLTIATVLLMFHRKHQHDVQWIHSERQPGNSVGRRHPRQESRKAVHNQIQACILADAHDFPCLETVRGEQSRNGFGIEEKVVFRDELPPASPENFKRQRIDIRCFYDKQTARPHSGGCSPNEASRRIHMLDDMKTCDDIEIGPRHTLDNVLMYWSNLAR